MLYHPSFIKYVYISRTTYLVDKVCFMLFRFRRRMFNFRVQRLHLKKRSAELMIERKTIAEQVTTATTGHDELRRRIAGITLTLTRIQSALEALTEREQKDGLSTYEH